MVFKNLFNYEQIKEWREKYYNYDQFKWVLKVCIQISDSIKNLEKKLKKTKKEYKIRDIKYEIERQSKILSPLTVKNINIFLILEYMLQRRIDYLKQTIKSEFYKIEGFFNKKYKALINDFQIVKNVLEHKNSIEESELKSMISNLKVIIGNSCRKKDIVYFCNHTLRTIYEITTWLKNFSIMNGLAFDKIMTKCEKHLSEHKVYQSLINEEKVENYIKDYVEIIEKFREDIVKLYAKEFLNGNEKEAWSRLRAFSPVNIFKDPAIISMLLLLVVITVVFIILYCLAPKYPGFGQVNYIDILLVYFPAFNFSFQVLLLQLMMAFEIFLFKRYRINFTFLLELPADISLKAVEIFRAVLIAICAWALVFLAYSISIFYFYYSLAHYLYLYSVIILLVVFLFVLWPFKCPLRQLRIYFTKLFIEFLSPFGESRVHFKLVVYSAYIATLYLAYVQLTVAMCFFWCPECRDLNYAKNCDVTLAAGYVLEAAPYLLRMLQSINSLYYTKKLNPHLYNAIRFFSALVHITTGYLERANYMSIYIYIPIAILNYLYALFWDYKISWGLMEKNSKHFLLRDKINYPIWYYHFAIVSDLFLRAIFVHKFLGLRRNIEYFIAGVVKIIWRFNFIALRVEFEQVKNPEKLRKFLNIPELIEQSGTIT